jgi:PaaX-like protein
VSSTVSLELADSGSFSPSPEPWTSPGATAQRPPRLLLTLLGDYWWQRTEPLPSAAIVALLAEFGVSDSAARAALSRRYECFVAFAGQLRDAAAAGRMPNWPTAPLTTARS